MADAKPSAHGDAVAAAPAPVAPDVARVSPIARLYRHALESVFGFLDLKDLSRVLAVCRAWDEAVRSMKSIDAAVRSDRVLPWQIAASPLASHVRHFGSRFFALVTSSSDLFILSRPPMSLLSLACVVDLSQSPRLFLGASLQTLTLRLEGPADSAPAINQAILAVSRLPVLEDLSLRLPSFFPEVSFAPFAVAPQLQLLRCYALDDGQPTQPQLDQLRMSPHLMKMDLNYLSRGALLHWLRTPHALQWQEIHPIREIDDEVAAVLSTLPTLTKLDTVDCRSVAFLPALKNLRSLELDTDSSVRLAADIASGLSYCCQLTELVLCAGDVTSEHLSQALSYLPLLRALDLTHCPSLDSLAFLSECSHLAQSLQSLRLCRPAHPVALSAELAHVFALSNLTELVIHEYFVDELDPQLVAALTPPSSALPKLEQFQYKR